MSGTARTRMVLGMTVMTLLLVGCSGGGGGNGGGGQIARIVGISVPATGADLWTFPGTVPIPCPAGVPVNAPIIFTFAGPVDVASLPAPGAPNAAIRILIPGVGTVPEQPAQGSYSVADDPSLPPGNQRRIVFQPLQPLDAMTTGLALGSLYQVDVAGGPAATTTITIGGVPLENAALTCFETCAVAPGGTLDACLEDPVPGAPFVTQSYPPSDAVAPAPFDPANLDVGSPLNPLAMQANTITLVISEPLFPTNIDVTTVRLVNTGSGAQVPGQVVFYQAGTPEAGPDTARIDYVASSQLLQQTTYAIEVGPEVRDLSGNPIEVIQGSPTTPRLFATGTSPVCPQVITESFDDSSQLASRSFPGLLDWSDTGVLQAVFPVDLVGDGTFGPLIFGPGTHVLDTGMPASPGFADGAWNLTDLTVQSGALVRIVGPRPAHFRCLGTVSISGNLDADAGTSQFAPIGDPEQGPRPGQFDNGSLAGQPTVFGGQAGPGGGRGGNASQSSTLRTEMGESGFGPSVDGQLDPGTLAPTSYGGGQGGDSGFFPAQVAGELGGHGGAGGSAWASGEPGQPEDNTMGCAPITTGPQPIAQPTGATPAFAAPVTALVAGSGGGGGGDHLDITGVQSDDQGGGGGGSGGGLRITSVGSMALTPSAVLSCNGATGAQGSLFAGAGAGGSGGMIWLQTFSQLAIDANAAMTTEPGGGQQACTRFKSGAGGAGLMQLEDLDGAINTNFIGSGNQGGMNVFALQSPFGTTFQGDAISKFYDSGYAAPSYTTATLATDPVVSYGNAPGALVEIYYQAAHESLAQPGTPDLSTLTAEVTGATIATLSGYRYIRFRVVAGYAPPPQTTQSDILPSVQEISIGYDAPLGCP